jgi:glucose-6-phosphate-specific signal transduction histidine kinase
MRYAPHGAVNVFIGRSASWLTIVVSSRRGMANMCGIRGSGKGLASMAQRVARLGGRLVAGPEPDQGFRVWARVPTRASGMLVEMS